MNTPNAGGRSAMDATEVSGGGPQTDEVEFTVHDAGLARKNSDTDPHGTGSLDATQGLDGGMAAETPMDATVATGAPQPAKSANAKTAGAKEQVTVLGDFRLLKKLGQGGMGAVYKAHQVSLDRPVALKVMAKHLADNKNFVERFYREARIQAKLDHPNIVRGFWVGAERGLQLFAMEFIDGGSVQSYLKKLGKFNVGDSLHITLATLHALAHAHDQNMIHRDIKPDNLLITSKGQVKVADLGLAKAIDDDMSLTQSGMGAGTPYYMSPEQARNAKHADGRTDIYAIGCMLYVFLTGKMPFEGETTLELVKNKESGRLPPPLRKALKDDPAALDIPEKLDLIVGKMVQKDPKDRHQTCAEVIKDLEALKLASATLSFIQGATAALGQLAPAASAKAATKPVVAPTKPPPPRKEASEWWFVQMKSPDGKRIQRKLSTLQIQEMIRSEDFDLKAIASKSDEGPYRALATYSEFESSLRGRLERAKADRRQHKLKDFVENIDEAEKKYRRGRFFNKLLGSAKGLISLAIILALIAGAGYVAYDFVVGGPVAKMFGMGKSSTPNPPGKK